MRKFFISEQVEDILDDPDRIINADESGFNICTMLGLVLDPRGMANLYEIRDKEKQSTTVLGTFSASRSLARPKIKVFSIIIVDTY